LSSTPRVAILTRRADFHAHAIRWALGNRGAACAIVETDGLASSGGMTWSTAEDVGAGVIRDADGQDVVVRALDAIWWRRLTGAPRLPDELADEAARDLVERECRATLVGLVLTEFDGAWISHPEATRLAEYKLVQLQAAHRAGLRLPKTLVSQDPAVVRRFCEELDFQVVVKTVAGTPKTPVMTGRVTPEMLRDGDVAVCPAIYQELVRGTRHLRICCFGDEIHTAMLETEALDWRYPLDAHVEPYALDGRTADSIRRLLRNLGLKMGIADMKLGPDGTPVWLELNPQGQFLFLEGMCELSLTNPFADFLLQQARGAEAGTDAAGRRLVGAHRG
jgi:hypothetical protein